MAGGQHFRIGPGAVGFSRGLQRWLGWLLLGLLVSACGSADEQAPGLQAPLALELRSVGQGPRPELRYSLELARLRSRLSLEAQRMRVVERAEPALAPATSGILAWDPRQIRLHLWGEWHPRRFDAMEVEGVVFADCIMGVHLLRRGQVVAAGERLAVQGSKELRRWRFEFPELAGESEPCDALSVVVLGKSKQQVGLVRLLLLQSAPLAAHAGERLTLGLDSRPALALGRGQVAEAVFPKGSGGSLRFHVGRPSTGLAGPAPAPVTLCMSVTWPDQVYEREREVAVADRWLLFEDEGLDRPLDGARLRIEVRGAGPHALAFVTEPRLHAGPPDPRPLTLLITSDTHRADHVGFAAKPALIETPALDALAARGLRFLDCWSTTNVTNPSHAAILTGLPPRDTGVVDNTTPLGSQASTVAEAFRAAGYETWAAVSVPHLGHERSGLAQGFSRFSAPVDKDRPGPETIAVLEDWLAEEPRAPRFAWLHLFDVHGPYEPPADFVPDPSEAERRRAAGVPLDQLPGWARGKDVAGLLAAYRGEVDYLDQVLAPFLAQPVVRSGVVALTSDHGESLGGHSVWFDHRGLYPGTLAVPLVLAGPGVPAGETRTTGVSHLDLAATLLALAGVPGGGLPGANLLDPLAQGEQEPRFQLSDHALAASVRLGRDFLVLNLRDHPEARGLPPLPQHQVRLFDLEDDPACLHDRSGEEPERSAELRRALVRWLSNGPTERLATSREVETAAELEELGRLGYAAGSAEGAGAWFDAGCTCEFCSRF